MDNQETAQLIQEQVKLGAEICSNVAAEAFFDVLTSQGYVTDKTSMEQKERYWSLGLKVAEMAEQRQASQQNELDALFDKMSSDGSFQESEMATFERDVLAHAFEQTKDAAENPEIIGPVLNLVTAQLYSADNN